MIKSVTQGAYKLLTKGVVLISIKYKEEKDYLEKIQLICKAFGKVHINLTERETMIKVTVAITTTYFKNIATRTNTQTKR